MAMASGVFSVIFLLVLTSDYVSWQKAIKQQTRISFWFGGTTFWGWLSQSCWPMAQLHNSPSFSAQLLNVTQLDPLFILKIGQASASLKHYEQMLQVSAFSIFTALPLALPSCADGTAVTVSGCQRCCYAVVWRLAVAMAGLTTGHLVRQGAGDFWPRKEGEGWYFHCFFLRKSMGLDCLDHFVLWVYYSCGIVIDN